MPSPSEARAGLSPAGRQSKVGVGILFKIGSDFVQKVPPFYNFGVFEGYYLAQNPNSENWRYLLDKISSDFN